MSKINVEKKEEVCQVIEKLLNTDLEYPPNVISVYDLSVFLKETYEKIRNVENHYVKIIRKNLGFLCSSGSHVWIIYSDLRMKLEFTSIRKDIVKLEFNKNDEDFYISKCSDESYINRILPLIGREASMLYDHYLEFNDYYNLNEKIQPLNQGFLLSITSKKVEISKPEYFVIRRHTKGFDDDIECNSLNLAELLTENKKELLKRIYVEIDACPEWMREALTKKRECDFIIEEIANERERVIENAKHKTKEFIKKIFPYSIKITKNE